MSKIDQLIKDLQLKKTKIDYLKYIKDTLTNDQKCIDYVEVQEEVLSKLNPLIDGLISSIEDGIETAPAAIISKEDMDTVKLLLDKVKNRTPKDSAPVKPQKDQKKKEVLTPPDKMSFAMDNRHLSNQAVRVLNDENLDVTGVVVGLDAPFVIVKTNNGPTISVPLEKVVIS